MGTIPSDCGIEHSARQPRSVRDKGMTPASSMWRGVGLWLALLAAYLGNGENLGTGDTLPARQLPLSILRSGNFYLDDFSAQYKQAALHSVELVNDHWVSSYPVGAPLLSLPFYVPAVMAGIRNDSPLLATLEKLSASCIVGLSVLVLVLAIRRLTRDRSALLIGLLYGLGTSSLSMSSQALWQHGASQLALSFTLYCLARGVQQPHWVAWAGFPLAFAVLCRPTNVLFALPIVLYVLFHHTRRALPFFLTGVPVGAFLLWYNLTYFSEPFHSQFPIHRSHLWVTPLWEGFAGLLVSPGRGLFAYSPFLLFSIWGFAKAWRSRSTDPAHVLLRYSSVGIAFVVLVHCKWWSWWGGVCYGPRLLADILPPMCLGMYPVMELLLVSRQWRRVVATLAVWSVLAHFQGAYWDDGRWTGYVLPDGLWSWADSPLLNPAREIVNRVRISVLRLPTTQTQPNETSASYSTTESTVRPTGAAGDQIRMTVLAANTGSAVWIAWPKHRDGTVQLQYLLKATASQERVVRRGRIPLRHDVFPGAVYEFPIPMVLPPKPGEYVLQTGLVSMQGPSFAALGSAPLQIQLRVLPREKVEKRRPFISDEGG